ncbi:type III PLP-dependent enzyme [Candidatus Saccharibacteria bacterium]|nr:type III PLP-dependent enzyme [Candidatus Saccharibacteria bacterium]
MIPNDIEILNEVRLHTYQTPYFFTSRNILEINYQKFLNMFEGSEVYYALKANSDPKILTLLNGFGCGFEAASFYEIEQLLAVGIQPDRIIYGTSVKPSTHIMRAFDVGVNRFAADSHEELEKIAQFAPGSRVIIRAKVNDSGSVFAFSERFGAPKEAVKALVVYARHLKLKTYGLSFHVGSQATHVDHWANAISSLKPIMDQLDEEGIRIEILDIGGGFPVIYNNHKDLPHLDDIAKDVHKALKKLPYQPKIIMEPGRGIVASSTVMVSEVISRTIRNGKVWLVMDGGIYNCLYEAMIHQGTTQYDVRTMAMVEGDVDMLNYGITGPTGDSLDVITRSISLPSFISEGDRLIFENSGAYTITMASPFNGFPKPELYLS